MTSLTPTPTPTPTPVHVSRERGLLCVYSIRQGKLLNSKIDLLKGFSCTLSSLHDTQSSATFTHTIRNNNYI